MTLSELSSLFVAEFIYFKFYEKLHNDECEQISSC